jgi:hypothetical protein
MPSIRDIRNTLFRHNDIQRSNTMTISDLKQGTLTALMLVFMALGAMTACASTDDGGNSDKDELCDEADAGSQGCPD